MKSVLRSVSIALAMLLLLGACAVNKAPDWARDQISDPNFYSAVVSVSRKIPSYRDYAREQALRQISSQINVTVRAELETRERENAGYIFTDLAGRIQSSSETILQNVELVRFSENSSQYYAWYRISKLDYRRQRESRKQQAMNLALGALGRYDDTTTDLANGITGLLQSIEQLESFADLDLRAEYRGGIVNLYTVALSRLRELPGRLQTEWEVPQIRIVAMMNANAGIKGLIQYRVGDMLYPAQNLPVTMRFSRGRGRLSGSTTTNTDGSIDLVIQKVSDLDPMQEITLSIDKGRLAQAVNSSTLRQTINQLAFSEARLRMEVSKPSIYLDLAINEKEDFESYLQLKGRLLELDLEVTRDILVADYRMLVSITSRAGTYIDALRNYTTNADIQTSLVDIKTGSTVSAETYPNVKGAGTTQSTADLRAKQAALRILTSELLYRSLQTTLFTP